MATTTTTENSNQQKGSNAGPLETAETHLLHHDSQQSTFDRKTIALILLFLSACTFMFLVLYNFPSITEYVPVVHSQLFLLMSFIQSFIGNREEKVKLYRFPRGADDLRLINSVIQRQTQDHYYHVLLAFCSLYIL